MIEGCRDARTLLESLPVMLLVSDLESAPPAVGCVGGAERSRRNGV